jgi:hypothetical protein
MAPPGMGKSTSFSNELDLFMDAMGAMYAKEAHNP